LFWPVWIRIEQILQARYSNTWKRKTPPTEAIKRKSPDGGGFGGAGCDCQGSVTAAKLSCFLFDCLLLGCPPEGYAVLASGPVCRDRLADARSSSAACVQVRASPSRPSLSVNRRSNLVLTHF
jgi:hypothetical protein